MFERVLGFSFSSFRAFAVLHAPGDSLWVTFPGRGLRRHVQRGSKIDMGEISDYVAAVIYLDHNATSPLRPEAMEAMAVAARTGGNPSSVHLLGQRANHALETARDAVRGLIGTVDADVVFTGGGTEADLIFLLGVARARRQEVQATRISVSDLEHPAVQEAATLLGQEGFDVERLPVSPDGTVDIVGMQLDDKTAWLALMLANNETGAIQPIREVAELARASQVLMLCDGVQAAGKIPIEFDAWGLDVLTLSAHKFGGPRGIGAMVMRRGLRISCLWGGGEQEGGTRPGTVPMPLVAGMGAAATLARAQLAEHGAVVECQRDRLQALCLALGEAHVIAGEALRLPNTLSITFDGVSASALVQRLSTEEVMIGTGAACHGNHVGSLTLGAMGVSAMRARGVVRISLGWSTTDDEIERAGTAIGRAVVSIRGESS